MNKKGFTLVEILAVIVILSLVIVIVSTKGFGVFDNAKSAISRENLNTLKKSANELAAQIESCDDDVDNELWEGDNSLANLNGISNDKKDCSGLKEKMSSNECISVTVGYLIENNYLSDNDDFTDIKNNKIKICKNSNKIVINTDEIDKIDSDDKTKDNEDMTLAKVIIKNAKNPKNSNSTTLGSEVTTFTSVSGENEHVLNTAPDDYGTSYYFRGNVIDNYVSFADKVWRIVRINGDKTVRLILQEYDRFCSEYPKYSAINVNAGVGYMYGDVNGDTYDETHANINNSNIKLTVDNWFKDNLKTNYSNYLADTLFCGDKTLYEGDGIAKNKTYYSAYARNFLNSTPTLKCAENASDNYSRYSVTKIKLASGKETNGNLTYPIGLLTIDEATFAGNYKDTITTGNYLYTDNEWHTMSPYGLDTHGPAVFSVTDGIDISWFSWRCQAHSRPVINLKNDLIVESGDGTKDNPYRLKID